MEEYIILTLGFTFMTWVALQWINLLPIEERYRKYLCPKCVTFWITLIFTGKIFIAATAAFLAMVIDKYINN